MGNKIYETDGLFNSANSVDYNLLVEIGSNYYSYAVLDETHKIKAISYSEASILSPTIDNTVFSLPYKSTKISLQTQNFTFIPSQLYNDGDRSNYAQFLIENESTNLHTYQFLDGQINSLNTFDESKLIELKNLFPKAVFYPQYIPFIEGAEHQLKNDSGIQLIINKKINHVEILIFKGNNLKFYNFFECINDDELFYYLLTTCQHNQINPQETTLKIAGQLNENSHSYSFLKKTFYDIQFLQSNSIISNAGEFPKFELHNFFSLLNLSKCG